MSYKAFLSYSHTSDLHLAMTLQQGLQQFAKVWYQLRAIRVFRDKTGIVPGQGLTSAIKRALDQSEYFVLLASPLSARSEWVDQEVAHWLANRDKTKIIIVLTEGELNWPQNGRDFDWNTTNALPKALTGAFTEEPVHLDLRWCRSGELLSLKNPRFRAAVADLASILRDIPRDILDGDDVRQHQRAIRFRRTALAAVALLFMASLTAGFFAYRQKELADSNARIAEQNDSEARKSAQDAEKSRDQANAEARVARSLELARKVGQSDLFQESLELGIEAVQSSPTEAAVKALRSTAAAWFNALETAPRDFGLRSDRSPMAVDAVGRRIAVASPYGSAVAIDLEHRSELEICTGLQPIDSLFFSPDGRYLLVVQGTDLHIWDVQQKKRVGDSVVTPISRRGVLNVWFLPDGKAFIAPGRSRTLRLFSLPSGQEIANLPGTERDDTVLFNPSAPSFLTYNATGPTDPTASMWTLRGKFLWSANPIGFWWASFYKGGSGLIASLELHYPSGDRLEIYTWTIGKDGVPRDFRKTLSPDFDLAEIAGEPGRTFLNVLPLNRSECSSETSVATPEIVICGVLSPILYETAGARRVGPLPGWPSAERSAATVVDATGALVALEKDEVSVWEVRSRQVIWKTRDKVKGPILFSADSKRVLALNDGAPLAFDARTGKPVQSQVPPGAFTSPVLNWLEKSVLWTDREGKRMIGRSAHDLCVWDIETGRLLQRVNLFAHTRRRLEQDRKALNRASPEQLVAIAKDCLQGCRPAQLLSAR